MSTAPAADAGATPLKLSVASAPPNSLLGSLPLTQREIEQREALVATLPDDGARLASCWSAIRPDVDSLVAGCLARLSQLSGAEAFVDDRSNPGRMQRNIVDFLESTFCSSHDTSYASSRLQVGFVHRHIGLPSRYFLATLHHLHVGVRKAILARGGEAAEVAATFAALERRLLFDQSLIIDAYEHRLLAEARREHNRALRYSSTLESQVAARTRELERLSRTDSLTGLCNRRAFREELAREITRSRRQQRPLAALYIDVDDFKGLNDRKGHARGDAALVAVATTVRRTLRAIDITARIGGDEFCALLPDTDREHARAVTDRLRQEVLSTCPVTVSVGLAVLEERDWDDPAGLIERADAAMYRDKSRRPPRGAARRPAT